MSRSTPRRLRFWLAAAILNLVVLPVTVFWAIGAATYSPLAPFGRPAVAITNGTASPVQVSLIGIHDDDSRRFLPAVPVDDPLSLGSRLIVQRPLAPGAVLHLRYVSDDIVLSDVVLSRDGRPLGRIPIQTARTGGRLPGSGSLSDTRVAFRGAAALVPLEPATSRLMSSEIPSDGPALRALWLAPLVHLLTLLGIGVAAGRRSVRRTDRPGSGETTRWVPTGA